jgi:hypothetical protein
MRITCPHRAFEVGACTLPLRVFMPRRQGCLSRSLTSFPIYDADNIQLHVVSQGFLNICKARIVPSCL